ncbi:MAG: cytochrome c3 family protein [Phycisphaerae bacterium]
MTQAPAQTAPPRQPGPRRRRFRWSAAGWLSLLVVVLTVFTVYEYYSYYQGQLGPLQPISFSHRVHATDKQISCFVCHTGAIDTAHSGVPPMETCMMCHSRIITEHPQIVKLREDYEAGRPIQWRRVNTLPEFVYFDHHVHVRAGFDCGRCHGDVKGMDRVYLYQDFLMGFCVQCHRDNNFSHDCLICHR